MKKVLLSIITGLILGLTYIQAQNNIWSLPPNYYDHNLAQVTPLPAPGGCADFACDFDNYDGQPAEFMHNAMQDANGDLLFFIVDGVLYDKDGYGINVLQNSTGNTSVGFADLSIIPVPDNCNQFYIVNATYGGLHIQPRLEYALLDLTVYNPWTLRNGTLLDVNTGAIMGTWGGTTFSLNVSVATWHQGKISLATTKLRHDNTRFLFCENGKNISRFIVNSNGIFYDGYSFDIPNVTGNYQLRSEMEVVETSAGYRLALGQESSGFGIPASIALFVAELNVSGTVLSTDVEELFSSSGSVANIKGLEFSPNGNYVYITHDPSINYPIPFKIYDVTAQNFLNSSTINTLLLSDIPNYNNSQIELGNDGKLYLANATNLATIDNSDNPNALIWNNSEQAISYNLNSLSFPITGTS